MRHQNRITFAPEKTKTGVPVTQKRDKKQKVKHKKEFKNENKDFNNCSNDDGGTHKFSNALYRSKQQSPVPQ
jgi:hypothetical protein